MLPFAGAAVPIKDSDLDIAAHALGCDVAAVRAVLTVETGGAGGFLSDGSKRPRILFEAAVFSRLTHGNFDASHPNISAPKWDPRLYIGGAGEYDRLTNAVHLDRAAALQSTSWGMFQVMGENSAECGIPDVEHFVAGMAESEVAQLLAFSIFCMRVYGLAAALRGKDWASFARGYNGPGYAANHYDTRLARAYQLASTGIFDALQIGCFGPGVVRLQTALNAAGAAVLVDGQFGRVTELAVQRFQATHSLTDDGLVGTNTERALGMIATSSTMT
jgi:hypothetical protein